jgi:hypothetical protein
VPPTTTTAELSPLMKSLLQGGEAEEDEEYSDSVEGEKAEDEEAKRKSKGITKHLASISAEKIMCITSASGLLEHDDEVVPAQTKCGRPGGGDKQQGPDYSSSGQDNGYDLRSYHIRNLAATIMKALLHPLSKQVQQAWQDVLSEAKEEARHIITSSWNRMELALARQISSETNHAVFLAKGGMLVWCGSASTQAIDTILRRLRDIASSRTSLMEERGRVGLRSSVAGGGDDFGLEISQSPREGRWLDGRENIGRVLLQVPLWEPQLAIMEKRW